MADETVVLAPVTENPAPVTTDTPAPVADQPATDAAPVAEVIVPDWRDDWREKMAGGDAKELTRLQRFKSPVDVNNSRRELERKMSSGEVKAKLAEGATDEQVAAWRKDNGIPEKPDGYLEKLTKGLVIGDADKPVVDAFLGRVHGKNADPAVVADVLDWYYEQQAQAVASQSETDAEYRSASTAALGAEWGGEFERNIKSIKAFLDAAPPTEDGVPLKSLLMDARLGDGTRLGDNPAALRWLAGLAAEANPAGFVAPNGGSQTDALQTEMDGMKTRMRDDPSWSKDTRAQERYLRVVDALSKREGKG